MSSKDLAKLSKAAKDAKEKAKKAEDALKNELKKLNAEITKKKASKKKIKLEAYETGKKVAFIKKLNDDFDDLEIDIKYKEKVQSDLEDNFNNGIYEFNGNELDHIYWKTQYDDDKELLIIRTLAKSYDLGKNLKNGKLTDKFMDKVNFDFEFTNMNEVTAYITFENITNIETEIVLINVIAGNFKIIPNKYRHMFTKLRDYFTSTALQALLAHALLDNIELTIYPFLMNKKGKVISYRNPENQQHRYIKTDKRSYKKIFGKIRLRDVTVEDVNIDNIEYNIKNNCVKSYFNLHYGKDNVIQYLKEDEPNTFEILDFAREVKLNVYTYDQNKVLMYKYNCESKYKDLHYFFHNNHMFVFKPDKTTQESMSYKKDLNLDEEYNKKIYVDTEQEYKKLYIDYSKKYSMINCGNLNFPIKNNCSIIFDPNYKKKREQLDTFKYNSDNVHTCIDAHITIKTNNRDKTGLRGYLNEDTLKSLDGFSKIRNFHTNIEDDIRYDMVSCYLSILFQYLIFPINTVNDYWEKYNNEDIEDYYIYFCSFNSYDKILHPIDDAMMGTCVKFLKEKGIIKKIKYVLKIVHTKNINKKLLPSKFKDQEKEEKHFDKEFLIYYIGWLMKMTSEEVKKSIVNDEEEVKGLLDYYKNSSAYIITKSKKINTNKDGIVDTNNNKFQFKYTSITNKFNNGMIINFMIKDLINLTLYKFNEKFMKDNPDSILNTIKTDALGYILKKKPIHNNYVDANEIGKFKIEKYTFDEKNIKIPLYNTKINISINKIDKKHKINKTKINTNLKKEYKKEDKEDKEDIKEFYEITESTYEPCEIIIEEKQQLNIYPSCMYLYFITHKKSFFLDARGGYGKSYLLDNHILPCLLEKEYIMTSVVVENCKQYKKCRTLQSLLNKKSNNELIRTFKKKKYLIIDEAVQITQMNLLQLEFIKNNTNCKFIMLSDMNQTIVDNYEGLPFINTYFTHKLMDFNMLKINKHKNIRYDDELNKIIDKVEELKDDLPKLRQYVIKTFKNNKESNDAINLCYTNNYRLNSDDDCKTVHIVQGKTLKDNYSIHEINKMPFDVIYTAVTRATTKDQITIIFDIHEYGRTESANKNTGGG